ncbi:MAG: hypothetical protein V4463_11385 [Pseudomonadota bacterium]
MKTYTFELMLAALLASLLFAVCYWQAPGHRLTAAEIDGYTARIERLAPMPAADKAAFLAALRTWGQADDGAPVYMLNLMRYYPQLRPWPGVTIKAATPLESNAHYEKEVTGMALAGGLQMPVASNVQGVRAGAQPSTNLVGQEAAVDNWSRVLVVRYPCRRAFFELVSNPDYLKVMPYKFAALQLALVPTDGASVTPDVRLVSAALALFILLATGWWRAARRAG